MKAIEWKIEWFRRAPRNLWAPKEKQRQFFDHLRRKLSIRSLEEWNQVTRETVTENGGGTLLHTYYAGSVKAALRSIYPGTLHDVITQFRNGLERKFRKGNI